MEMFETLSIADLLGMLPEPEEHFSEVFMDIEEWLSKKYGDYLVYIYYNRIPFKTWPELLLAFVQYKVKGLEWDGEAWR